MTDRLAGGTDGSGGGGNAVEGDKKRQSFKAERSKNEPFTDCCDERILLGFSEIRKSKKKERQPSL